MTNAELEKRLAKCEKALNRILTLPIRVIGTGYREACIEIGKIAREAIR